MLTWDSSQASSDSQPGAVAVPEIFGKLLDRRIIWPGLEEEHGPPCVLGQTCRQYCRCRTRANHDGIITPGSPPLMLSQVCRWDYNREGAAGQNNGGEGKVNVLVLSLH